MPLGLVEKSALGSLKTLVLVEAEVPVDAAGLVLGFPDTQTGQGHGQYNKHDDDEHRLHDLLHLPEHRFDELFGIGLKVKCLNDLIWELQDDRLPPFPVHARRNSRALGFVLTPGQPELCPGLLVFEGLEHACLRYSARAARSSSAERTMRAQ